MFEVLTPSRQQLRQAIRQQRRALTVAQQHHAAQQLARRLKSLLICRQAQHIAIYLPADGEISLIPFAEMMQAAGKKLYLPIINPANKRLLFARYQQGDALIKNRLHIWEPKIKRLRPSWALDLVLMPLVAFDAQGNRLGMGGGFYDCTFANKGKYSFGPRLIGIAHQLQQVAQLPIEPWDVPVSGVATDQQWFSRFVI